jgi:hypothetical protein
MGFGSLKKAIVAVAASKAQPLVLHRAKRRCWFYQGGNMATTNGWLSTGTRPFVLGDRWQSRLKEIYPQDWQKPLTAKERGQLKDLANVLGASTNEAIEWTIRNWSKFASSVSIGVSLSYPSKPQIGFLLVHCAVAMNLMRRQAELAAKEAERAARQAEQMVRESARREEEGIRQTRLAERNEDGRRKYNDRGEEIHYMSDEELAALLERLDKLKRDVRSAGHTQ